MRSILAEMQLSDLIDIAVVSGLLWLAMVWLRNSRARLALLGAAMLGGVYLIAAQLRLDLTARILQGFFAVSVLVGVIVFQDDLRRLFERIAVLGLRRAPRRSGGDVITSVVGAVRALAENHTGALIVIPGRDPLTRHLEGGTHLRGRVSEELLLSLFDPHSPGHDGAAVLEGNEIVRFAVHLPLSIDHDMLGLRGTRHAAALGLSERSDALCILVSEERGQISVARDAILVEVDAGGLEAELQRFLARVRPPPARGPSDLASRLAVHWREGALSGAVAVGLWAVLIPGSTVARVDLDVPVVVENLPEGFALKSVDPPELRVTIEGLRRDVLLANKDRIHVRIDALLAQLGRRTFAVTPDLVELPQQLTVVSLAPAKVRLRLERPGGES